MHANSDIDVHYVLFDPWYCQQLVERSGGCVEVHR